MAKVKRRERGVVKGWVVEAYKAGKRKAKEIAGYIQETHGEEVSEAQIYGIMSAAKLKKGKRLAAASSAAPSPKSNGVGNGRAVVNLMKSLKDLAEQAGGMDRLIEIAQMMK